MEMIPQMIQGFSHEILARELSAQLVQRPVLRMLCSWAWLYNHVWFLLRGYQMDCVYIMLGKNVLIWLAIPRNISAQ